jgi:hypothetical protein
MSTAQDFFARAHVKPRRIRYPRVVFETNVGSLGDIRNQGLIRLLVSLYSTLDQLNKLIAATERTKRAGIFIDGYVERLTMTFDQAVRADMQLQHLTSKIKPDYTIYATERDADDHNLAVGILKKLGHSAAPRFVAHASEDAQPRDWRLPELLLDKAASIIDLLRAWLKDRASATKSGRRSTPQKSAATASAKTST